MSDSILSRRWPWITAALLAVLAYAATLVDLRVGRLDSRSRGSSEDIERLAERQDVNVLFILIDTLRAERLGSYGYERETDPLLRHLSDNGVRFAHSLISCMSA